MNQMPMERWLKKRSQEFCLRYWLLILGVLTLAGCMDVKHLSEAAKDSAATASLKGGDGKEVGRAYAALEGNDLYVFVNLEAAVGKSLGLHRFVMRWVGQCDRTLPLSTDSPLSMSGNEQRRESTPSWTADLVRIKSARRGTPFQA